MGSVSILHADLDAFYASVEVRNRPRLRGLPVAVGGGVVLSCTYEARAFGVEGGMPIGEARRRCPRLVVVPGAFSDYVAESRRVFAVFERFTPHVEPVSIDEAFLDVSGAERLFGAPEAIGAALRAAVRAETGLTVSVGAARTKHLAKVAGRLAKPDGLLVVPPDGELTFLQALPVGVLWGVGPVVAGRLSGYGIRTVGDIAGLPDGTLERWVGVGTARHLRALAANHDPRPVRSGSTARSVGSQRTFAAASRDPARHAAVLLELADRVGRRLRHRGLAGRSITVAVRYSDYETATRRLTLPAPVDSTSAIYRVARRLAAPADRDPRGLRLLGVSVSLLGAAGALQLELPFGDLDPVTRPGTPQDTLHRALDTAVDLVRERFGHNALGRAALGTRERSATLCELAERALAREPEAPSARSGGGERGDQAPGFVSFLP